MDAGVSITYPDSSSGSDVVSYTYNRLGQQLTITDQRGTVRSLYYDGLGRLTNDCVSADGTGTDVAVKQTRITYNTRGMAYRFTSTDSATPGGGTVLNDVQKTFNDFNQLTAEAQAHGGSVAGGTPKVQYSYDTGASGSNEIRLNTMTYPNARVITYSYGTSGGMNDYLNRVDTIHDTTHSVDLASHTYLGAGTVVRITYPQPSVWLDLWGGTSGVFNGLDLFGRVIDQRWQNATNTMTPVDIDRYKYGYDYNSNRQWKANVVGTSAVGNLDEYYTYDAINRLTEMQRGTLTGTPPTGISGTPVREMDYTLDPTGNWSTYLTKSSGTTDLNQGRVANPVNEIASITESGGTPLWVTPLYDAAGNMTTMPQVIDPTTSFTATYDAWNRMTSISDTGGTVATYSYDGRNRRIIKVTTSSSETRHFYFTNAWQDIEERTGSPAAMDNQHVWGMRYIDELVCRDDPTNGRLYATEDANFNITGIVDASGTLQQYFVYDPYGTDSIYDGSWAGTTDAYSWSDRFTGRYYDSETGIYYYRWRYYLATIGGLVSRDPVANLNLYIYCKSQPISNLDPSGAVCACTAPPAPAVPPPAALCTVKMAKLAPPGNTLTVSGPPVGRCVAPPGAGLLVIFQCACKAFKLCANTATWTCLLKRIPLGPLAPPPAPVNPPAPATQPDDDAPPMIGLPGGVGGPLAPGVLVTAGWFPVPVLSNTC